MLLQKFLFLTITKLYCAATFMAELLIEKKLTDTGFIYFLNFGGFYQILDFDKRLGQHQSKLLIQRYAH